MNDREWAAVLGGNNSWYWCPEHKTYVLRADDKVTPHVLGELIGAGLGVTEAEVDFWMMAVAVVDQRRPVAA